MCWNHQCIPATYFDYPLPDNPATPGPDYPSLFDTCIDDDDNPANGEDACIDNEARCVTTEPPANCQ
jgi:hypothetical protein